MSKTPPPSVQIHFYTLSILLFSLTFYGNSQASDQELSILLKLKQHWRNPPAIDHWTSSNSSYCTWPEIECEDGSVTGIFLKNINITNEIPPFICDLKNITTIDLQLNYIPGGFPTGLYNCTKLEYLDLSQNCFVGPIPADVDRLSPRLYHLYLVGNNFSGDIPAAIGRLPELRFLRLTQNQFNGSFPPEIGNLSKLEHLGMAYNDFRPSEIPLNFTKLKNLKYLWMAQSNLIGEIPEMIGEMTALQYLDLSLNNLSGKIPSSLFLLKNLTELYLRENQFSGKIGPTIEAINLLRIDLSKNNLSGTIPEDFGRLSKLEVLVLYSNQFTGEIPESIGNLTALRDVRLFSNNLSGILPPDFGRYSMLEGFEVASNSFTGRLPENLCAGGKLEGLVAFDNKLSGELPESLGNCGNLKVVMVYNNSLSGNVPSGLWTLVNISRLMLSHNSFTGELPDELGWNLSRLEIRDNMFHGNIPAGVASWKNLVVFDAGNNQFSGPIPSELTALPLLTTLFLDRNLFDGHLPSKIVSWKSLTFLNLSRNQISGMIPAEIGYLPDLLDLDLSENKLSGQIPPEIGLLTLTFLNLSSNHLTGKIPSEFENKAYDSSFLNNPGLCTSNPFMGIGLQLCHSETRKKSKISSESLALILSVAAAAAVLALLFSFIVFRVYRRKKHRFDPTWKLTSFQRLNFTEANILSSLAETNVIGSGGSGKVYCVPVNHLGEVVAVKRIWTHRNLDHKLERDFLAEVEILGAIRHSNIIKLLCCVSSEDSKLLVYEYMEKRSLDRWLHWKRRPMIASGLVHHFVLAWPQRLKIAVDIAQGLCYMHHDCSPPIVHRDVKSSNILLDSEFNAKLADFGLAKMLIKPGELNTMSTVAGSVGYMAPESAHTARVSEKTDVYSFGVILLELVTGREASDGDEHTCLVEWAWQHIQEGKHTADALDKEIKEPCYLDEMSSVFKLGIICTGTLPSTRPSMRKVLKILLQYSNPQEVYGEKDTAREYDAAPLLDTKPARMSDNNGSNFASNV
ncbi:hypothetical protein PVL29_014150 [Vitis rotundifolia]|uniref:Protein kinase domain-containing protein n=1 Tax=Vitis rotundifolia TaxID=103349 RepID=A0AA38ZGB6_VITRO|nr:hypothetical protein PVL29_014150 [Vitis rotundifolia]